jgi:hypothetical protein
VIRTPDGHLLDVEGLDKVHGYTDNVDLAVDDIMSFDDYRVSNVSMARPFAVVLLRSVGLMSKPKRQTKKSQSQMQLAFA